MGNIQGHPVVLSILEFATAEDRSQLALISRDFHRLAQESYVQRWMCYRLMEDCMLYHPLKLAPGRTWKHIYQSLASQRDLWSPTNKESCVAGGNRQAKVQVYSRLRPFDNTLKSSGTTNDEIKNITLPLHQRLTLIKLSHGLKSNRQALQVLKEEGSWFGKKWTNINSEKEIEEDKENAVVNSSSTAKQRFSSAANSAPLTANIQSVDPGTGRVVIVAPDVGMREFSYDGVLPSNATQAQVYDRIASGLVTDVMNGYNATGIMYGQTGSGKTYTMFGPGIELPTEKSQYPFTKAPSKDSHGIVIRACEEIFLAIEDRKRRHGIEAEARVSYVEVYGDTVSDLLLNGKRCGQSKAASQQYVLSGAAEQRVGCMEDIRKLLHIGEAQKRRAATALNDRSTRAHSIFIFTLKQRLCQDGQNYVDIDFNSDENGVTTLSSKLFLADLGGSEQVKKSKVEVGQSKKIPVNSSNTDSIDLNQERDQQLFSTGFEMAERMREAVYINLGLLALKKCIEALNAKASYVPYQDSKLTMLLSAGLATGKTSVIICVNSDPAHITETIGTLRFGERCALIETEVRTNISMLESVLQKLNTEIRALEDLIKEKEVWEVVEERRVDELAEEGTMEASIGLERKVVTVLRGAEKERTALNALLLQRAELTGSDSITAILNKSDVSTFGGNYDKNLSYGVKYDPEKDLVADNERFSTKVNKAKASAIVRAKGAEWKTGADLEVSSEELERKARVVKRNRLVYSGLS